MTQLRIVAVSGWRSNKHDTGFLKVVHRLLWALGPDEGMPSIFWRVGDCKTGTDAAATVELLMAHHHCQSLHKPYVYRAKWGLHGKKAGPLRNVAMLLGLEESDPTFATKADLLVAWPEPLKRRQRGSGTWDCIEAAHVEGIPVVVL